MKTRLILKSNRWLAAIAFFIFAAATTFAQTTEFTYQGKLTDANGQAAAYDFEFRLCVYETLSCSPPLATFTKTNVPTPSSGIFTIKVDFGNNQFSGTDRYVEIAVRRTGETNYTTLAPRQEITSAPYAITSSESGDSRSLGGRSASQYVLTTDPRLSATHYVQNGTTAQTGVNFNVGGTGTAGILNAGTQFNLGGSRFLSGSNIANIFAGKNAGLSNTTGDANSFFGFNAGQVNTSGDNNSFFGTASGGVNNTGRYNSFFGASSGEENSTGQFNSFFGQSSGGDTTSGNSNSFVGFNAGVNNRTGGNNSALGANTTFSVNNLNFATAIGAGATVGTSNTLVLGRTNDAVQAPGSLNVGGFVGAGTQYRLGGNLFISDGGGAYNTYVGVSSNCNNANGTAGNGNTFVGYGSGMQCTTGTNNSIFGYGAGRVVTGNNNTIIGGGTRVADGATVNDSTAIGAFATVSKSNTIVLGRPTTNSVIKGNLQVYAGREEPGGPPGVYPAFESVTTTQYGPGLAASRLYLQSIANPVYTQSPICFAGSSGGQIPYGIVGYCANGTGRGSLKADVKAFSGGLEIVKRLNPIVFKWKENGESGIGLNAEDVAAAEPQLINRDEKGEIRDVKADGLNVVLINAVKEQQTQIEQQQREIDELKAIVCNIKPDAAVCKGAKR